MSFNPDNPFLFKNNGKVVCIDPQSGSGAVGNTANVNYMGFVVFMPPEKFLELSHPLIGGPRASAGFFEKALKASKEEEITHCIGPACLYMVDENGWKVVGHEGRHRATALKALGFKKMPVYIFPRQLRAHDVTPQMLKEMLMVQGEQGNFVDCFDIFVLGPIILQGKLLGTERAWRDIELKQIETDAQKTPSEYEGHHYYWSKPKKNPKRRKKR